MNYCTLFDSFYASRGINLIKSIMHSHSQADIIVLAMDELVADKLIASGIRDVRIVTLEKLQEVYPVLSSLSKQRTRAEFCWTLTSYIIHWCLYYLQLPECTYIDSDIFFYSSPELIHKSIGGNSVLITEHRYTPQYDQSSSSGKYCVQFMYFKNNEKGFEVLNWWKDRCTEWCFARVEPGRFGDQKYLDDWTSRFDSVIVSDEPGLGLAPWNVQQFEVINSDEIIRIRDKITKKIYPLFFYHFHGLKRSQYKNWYISDYQIDEDVKNLLYLPYITGLMNEEALHLDMNLSDNKMIKLLPTKAGISEILSNTVSLFIDNLKKLIKDSSPRKVSKKLKDEYIEKMSHYLSVEIISEEI